MSVPRVVAVLAQGGSGRIELAFRAEGAFRRMYAVKRLREGLAEDAKVREHFLREASITTRLRHPNVVSVLDLGTDERGPYLVMDHVLGVSLRELREALGDRPVPAQLVWLLGTAIARALHAVHTLADDEGRNLGLAHRDVTPSNVMVGYDGIVRLVDFGLARASDERTASLLQGTSGYLAPEQLRFEPVDGRADLFALGVILFELLHGRRLYGDADVRIAARRTLDESLGATDSTLDPTLNATLDPSEDELIRALLSKAPANRPQSAREVARRLEGQWRARIRHEGAHDVRAFLSSTLAGREQQARARLAELWHAFETPESAEPAPTTPRRRGALAAAIGVAGVVMLGALGWAVWPHPGSRPMDVPPTLGETGTNAHDTDLTDVEATAATGDPDDESADDRSANVATGDRAIDVPTVAAASVRETDDRATDTMSDDATPDDATPDDSTPDDSTPDDATPDDHAAAQAIPVTESEVTASEATESPSSRRPRRRPRRPRDPASDMSGLWSW